MIVYEGAGNDVKLVQLINNNFQQSSIRDDIPTPVTGSAFAIIPGAGDIEQVAMYINAVNLDETYYNGSSWTWTREFLASIIWLLFMGCFSCYECVFPPTSFFSPTKSKDITNQTFPPSPPIPSLKP